MALRCVLCRAGGYPRESRGDSGLDITLVASGIAPAQRSLSAIDGGVCVKGIEALAMVRTQPSFDVGSCNGASLAVLLGDVGRAGVAGTPNPNEVATIPSRLNPLRMQEPTPPTNPAPTPKRRKVSAGTMQVEPTTTVPTESMPSPEPMISTAEFNLEKRAILQCGSLEHAGAALRRHWVSLLDDHSIVECGFVRNSGHPFVTVTTQADDGTETVVENVRKAES